MHGVQGQVVGPSSMEGEGGVKLRFPGNELSIDCALAEVRAAARDSGGAGTARWVVVGAGRQGLCRRVRREAAMTAVAFAGPSSRSRV